MLLYCDIVKVGDEVLRVKCEDVKLPLDKETIQTDASDRERQAVYSLCRAMA